MQKIDANVVGIVTAVKETNAWVKKLAAIDAKLPQLVRAPLKCPLFTKGEEG